MRVYKKLLAIISLVIVLAGCADGNNELSASDYDSAKKFVIDNSYTVNEVKSELTKSPKNVLIYLYSPECGYCRLDSPLVKEMIDNKTTKVMPVDVSKYSDGWEFLTSLYSEEQLKTLKIGTPAYIYHKGDTVNNRIGAFLEYQGLKSFIEGDDK